MVLSLVITAANEAITFSIFVYLDPFLDSKLNMILGLWLVFADFTTILYETVYCIYYATILYEIYPNKFGT